MALGDMETQLSLATICQGSLEQSFADLYPKVVAAMKPGDKAGLSITVGIERMKDSGSMFSVTFNITPKFPARSKASLAQIDNEGKLLTDEPVIQSNLFALPKKEVK